MHFIHEINWFECFMHKTSIVFQNFNFSRISIDWMCFLTDRKSLEFLNLVLLGLIVPWLVRLFLDWCSINRNCFFDWSNTNFNRSKNLIFFSLPSIWLDWYPIGARPIEFWKKRTKRFFPSRVHHFFINFFYHFLLSLSRPIQSKLLCHFLPQNFQKFLSSIGR